MFGTMCHHSQINKVFTLKNYSINIFTIFISGFPGPVSNDYINSIVYKSNINAIKNIDLVIMT